MALLDGCDCIVFTAGLGENGIPIREMICDNMDFLGIKMDKAANKVRGKEVDVATPDSKVRIFVIPTNEELVIAPGHLRSRQIGLFKALHFKHSLRACLGECCILAV